MKKASGPVQPAKDSIVFVLKVLNSAGISCLTPEDLRQAKFNGPVQRKLWRALHDLFVLEAIGTGRQPGGRLDDFWSRAGLEATSDDLLPAGATEHVLITLQARGFPRIDLIRPDGGGSVPARELLTAFAWALAHTGILLQVLDRKLEAALDPALLPPFPDDFSRSPAAIQVSRSGEERAVGTADRLATAPPDRWGSRLDHALMLWNKVRFSSNALSALHVARVRQLAKLQSLQLQLGAKEPLLSPLELGLALDKDKLAAYEHGLRAAEQGLTLARDFDRHCRTFFQWISDAMAETGKAPVPRPLADRALADQLAAYDASDEARRERQRALGPATSQRAEEQGAQSALETATLLENLLQKAEVLMASRSTAAESLDPYLALADYRHLALDSAEGPTPAAGALEALYGHALADDVAGVLRQWQAEEGRRARTRAAQPWAGAREAASGDTVSFVRLAPKDKVDRAMEKLQGRSPYAPGSAAPVAVGPSPAQGPTAAGQIEALTASALEVARELARVRAANRRLVEQAGGRLEELGFRSTLAKAPVR